MNPVALSFGVAAILVIGLATLPLADDKDHGQSVAAAWMLFATWLISNLLWAVFGRDAVQAYPLMDLICGIVAALMFRARPQVWSAALTLCFLTQSFLHAEWAYSSWHGAGRAEFIAYLLKIDILYGLELASVSIPGGLHVAGSVGGWLSRRTRRRGFRLPQSRREG